MKISFCWTGGDHKLSQVVVVDKDVEAEEETSCGDRSVETLEETSCGSRFVEAVEGTSCGDGTKRWRLFLRLNKQDRF